MFNLGIELGAERMTIVGAMTSIARSPKRLRKQQLFVLRYRGARSQFFGSSDWLRHGSDIFSRFYLFPSVA